MSFVFWTSLGISAQPSKPIFPLNFGIWLDYSANFLAISGKWNEYNLNIQSYQQVATVSDNYLANGFGFGGIINVPITNQLFFTGRFGYNSFSTMVNYYAFDYLNRTLSSVEDGIDVNFSALEITPGILFYPKLKSLENLYIFGGLDIKSFLTKEFTNNLTQITTEYPDLNTRLALALGLGYTFQIVPNLYLSPEFSLRIPFTKYYNEDLPDIVDNITGAILAYHNERISATHLKFGLNLTFSLTPKEKMPSIPEQPEGVVAFSEVLAWDPQGRFVPATDIKVSDTRYQEYLPLVPYIFFEENSSTPAKGTQYLTSSAEAGGFEPKNLPMDALEINFRTLDIVGWRLKNNPRADLTVTGTIDGSNLEKQNKQLALERANFVKKYLVQNWNINEQRINIRTTQLPSKPSTTAVPEGVAENRRAELSSSNPEILAPILIEGESVRISEPSLIQFVPMANLQDSIVFWEIDIYQGNNLLKRSNGSGYPQPLHWNIKPNELSASNVPIDYTLIVETINGKKYKASGSLPTEYFSYTKKKAEDLPESTITKFSLVLFDFDKAEVSKQDQETINRLVIPSIKFNSTVKIYGYTDRIGDDDYNLKLASRRAEAVKNIIQQQRTNVKIETYGVGERQLLFDNDTPTGRHLSRTVQVVIVTPK